MTRRSLAAVAPHGLDRAGVVMSSACAIHCALMPLAAGVLPLVGLGVLADPRTETLLVASAAVIALVSLAGGCRHHGRLGPLALVAIGFSLILSGRLWAVDAEWLESALVVAGALAVATAHLVNWRMCCRVAARSCAGPVQE